MVTTGFDTHQAVKALTEAGFSETQAETMVSTMRGVIGSDLVTKTDLQTVKSELQAEIKDLELRLTLRLGGMMIAVGGLVVALVKLLP